jgi:large subunit ribosomal protein L13
MEKVTKFIKKEEVNRQWYVVDATDQILGRLAARVAYVLMGKHKPFYTPNVDCGDYVIVINADKVRLTGKKYTDKIYYWHTGYSGGLKQKSYGELLEEKPEKVIELAVKRMLPKNRLGRKMIKKLKVYRGSEHPHQAQNPVQINIEELKK